MTGAPLLSVVIPVRDGERYLRESIESVLVQTLGEFECLVVDDGSSDGTPEILGAYQKADPRVRVLRQEKAGLVTALNRGCAEAGGRYVARMDADDVALPDRFERQVRFLEDHHDVAVLGGAMQFMTAAGPQDRFLRHPSGVDDVKAALEATCCIAHPTVVIRKRVLDTIGGYRSQYLHAEDYDLWLRMADHHAVDNLPETLVRHRLHEGQVSFTYLMQQSMSSLGARTTARARRARGVDPTPAEGVITRDFLLDMGLRETAIDDAVIGDVIFRANLMLDLGLIDQAIEIADALRRIEVSGGSRRRLSAELAWLLAKVDLRKRHHVRGIMRLLSACLQRPSLLMNLVRTLPRAGVVISRAVS